jgi:hypothetical protein
LQNVFDISQSIDIFRCDELRSNCELVATENVLAAYRKKEDALKDTSDRWEK